MVNENLLILSSRFGHRGGSGNVFTYFDLKEKETLCVESEFHERFAEEKHHPILGQVVTQLNGVAVVDEAVLFGARERGM